jgi:EAL domain-containing protein (putative c-di-GMP-specific phosphodiesterase class I)
VRSIGPGIRLAVDDAGAGFASFRHILELRPAFVKLDRSLVAGIDSDPAKQALAAGMRQFAASTHCRLIAEGVETEKERATLLALDIQFAQGFLLGRPGVFVPSRTVAAPIRSALPTPALARSAGSSRVGVGIPVGAIS